MVSIICLIPIFALFAPFITNVQCQPKHDPCVDEVFPRFHQALITKFPQYENFTMFIPSSRHLFQNLLTQGFTSDTLKDYCRTYETARKEYDKCANSEYKKAVLVGFGLADYICLKRLNDYAAGIPCLAKADKTASDTCRSKCTQYEQVSYAYLHPEINGDITTYMAGDCQYLKCSIGCRQPFLEQLCDNKTASLERDAVVASYTSLYDLYQADTATTAAPHHEAPTAHFPEECRSFVASESPELRDTNANASMTTMEPIPPVIQGTQNAQTNVPLGETTTKARGGGQKSIANSMVLVAILCINRMIM